MAEFNEEQQLSIAFMEEFMSRLQRAVRESNQTVVQFLEDVEKGSEDAADGVRNMLRFLKDHTEIADKVTKAIQKSNISYGQFVDVMVEGANASTNSERVVKRLNVATGDLVRKQEGVAKGMDGMSKSIAEATKASALNVIQKKKEFEQNKALFEQDKDIIKLKADEGQVKEDLIKKETSLKVLRDKYNQDIKEQIKTNQEAMDGLRAKVILTEKEQAQLEALEEQAKKLYNQKEEVLGQIRQEQKDLTNLGKLHEAYIEAYTEAELSSWTTRRNAQNDALIGSNKLSEQIKGVFGKAATAEYGGFFENMKTGFDGVAKREKQRSMAMASKSFKEYGKEGRLQRALEKKRQQPGNENAVLTAAEKSAATKGRGMDLVKGLSGSLGSAMKGIFSKIGGMLSKAMGSVMNSVIGKLASIAASIGGLLTKIGDLMGITKIFGAIEIMVETIGELLGSMMGNTAKFQRELGMSAVNAQKLSSALASAADYSLLGPEALEQMQDSFAALVEYSGTYLQNMDGAVLLTAKVSRMTGISAQDSAMFTKHMQDGLGKSVDSVEKMVMSLRVDAQGAGLDFKGIMSDVAKQGSRMALYGEQIATGIMKAAVRAKQLGGDIKGWVSMTDAFADSFSDASDTAMSFNRIIGKEALSGYDLFSKGISGDTEGIMDSFTNAFKGMTDAQFKMATTGRMGQLTAKTMKMDIDQFQKYVERVDIERIMNGKFKGVQRGFSEMFGAGADAGVKKMYSQWEEGMKKSNKDVSQELIKMQEEAATQAALEYKRQGFDPNEFMDGLNKKIPKFVNMWQTQMQKQMGYQSFDDMKDALEKAMTPEERIEGLIKEMVKSFMPKIIQLLAIIARGIGVLVSVGNARAGAEIQKAAAGFGVMGSTFEIQNQKRDLKKSVSGGDLKKLADDYQVKIDDATDLEDSGQRKRMETQLNELLKKAKTEKEVAAVKDALASIKTINDSMSERERNMAVQGAKTEDIVKSVERNKEKGTHNIKQGLFKSAVQGMISPLAAYDGIKQVATGVQDYFAPVDVTQAKDIAFGKGKVKYVIDANKNVFELDSEDMVVASTNFNFGRDQIQTGKPLEKGSLDVSTQLATNGKQGSMPVQKKGSYSDEIQKALSDATVKMSSSIASQMSNEVGDSPSDLKASASNVSSQTMSKWLSLPSRDPQSIYQSGMPGDELVWNRQTGRFTAGSVPKDNYPPLNYMSPKTIRGFLGLGQSDRSISFSEIGKSDLSDKLESMGISSGMLPAWRPVLSKIESIMDMWKYPWTNGGMFNIRENRNNPSVYSNHSFATAKDYNTGRNPNKRMGSNTATDMPPSMLWAMYSALGDKFSWGGRYKSVSDAMHFELNKAGDLALDGAKYIVDSEGNAYTLGGESVMAAPNMKFSNALGGASGKALGGKSISQSIPMPKSWKDNMSGLGVSSPDFVDMNFFKSLLDLSKSSSLSQDMSGKMSGVSRQGLRDIGYTEQEINALGSSPYELFKRLYDELFSGQDDSVSFKGSRVDWKKFLDGSIGGGMSQFTEAMQGLGSKGGLVGKSAFPVISGTAKRMGDAHPDVLAAQWALESGWGKKTSGRFNYFGVKAKKGEQGTIASTNEDYGRGMERVKAKFKDYDSLDDAIKDRIDLMSRKKSYEGYLKAKSPLEAIGALKSGGYATDADYIDKLAGVMKSAGVNIADAYFGDGDVRGILTDTGFYTPKKSDAVAVGTGLPNLKTNTDLSQGELASYMGGSRGGGSSQGSQSGAANMELVALFKEFMRKMTQKTQQSTNNMSVTIDGEPVGRVVGKNISGHGRNLNGG